MNVLSTNNTEATSNSKQATAFGTNQVGKDDFLKLLVAQLSQQDPMNPMDDKDFMAQLAQFSSLEQMMQVNTGLSDLKTAQAATYSAQITNLIGKDVTVSASQIHHQEGLQNDLRFQLSGEAASVDIVIRDANGQVVRKIDGGSMQAGEHTIAWDGKTNSGMKALAGEYTVEITAKDASNKPVSSNMKITGHVNGVTYENGYPEVIVDNIRVRAGDIIEVRDS